MKACLVVFLALLAISCKSIVSMVENTNTQRKFENNQAYFAFVKNKIAIPQEKIIILDNQSCNLFISEVFTKRLGTYYGIMNKDSFVSADQLTIKSCSGQIETLYNMFADKSEKILKVKKDATPLGEKLKLDDSKNTLLFIYSYKLGGLTKTKIARVIRNLSKKQNFDYRLISMDNYDITVRQDH